MNKRVKKSNSLANLYKEYKQKNINKYECNKGITLIALVVTIVILLILAGISITLILGENGIIKTAQEAAEKTNKAAENEISQMEKLNKKINDIKNGSTEETLVTPIKDLVDKKVDENTKAKDKYGNQIVIPAGFKIVPDEESNDVDYTYTGDKEPAVQDGIVIEDVSDDSSTVGNQFVWVPVGKINNKVGEPTQIDLARYTFDEDSGAIKEKVIDGNTPLDDEYYELEANDTTYDNSKAKNIQSFIDNSKANKGYYIARFEASKGIGDKVASKTGQTVWIDVDQDTASTKSQEMYNKLGIYESDLINSFAWDTAIVFIQAYADNAYSKQTSKNSTLGVTGIREGETADKVCNIYDMASNVSEWSTESSDAFDYYGHTYFPYVDRGGDYFYDRSTSSRWSNSGLEDADASVGFRPLLNCSPVS